jgi:hypothetical protein
MILYGSPALLNECSLSAMSLPARPMDGHSSAVPSACPAPLSLLFRNQNA